MKLKKKTKTKKMSLLRTSLNALILAKTLNRFQPTQQTRYVKRWVAPTLRELRKRSKKLGPQEPQQRSGFIEWNYRSELFSFGKRLNEDFQFPLLQTAFTQSSYIEQERQRQHELGIEDADIQMTANETLAVKGEYLSKEYLQAFLQYSLPKVPAEGRNAFAAHLLSEETLAHIASHLGMNDLIFAAEYPPSQQSLAKSLMAVIGALEESAGVQRSFLFIRDFICTQMNQRDLLELWDIEDPEKLLKQVCEDRKLLEPEPRLLGDCGKNTVLAAYHVGIYSNKQIIGKGFGEDVQTATKTASLDALQKLFGIEDNMLPFDFQVHVEPKSFKLS